MADPSVDQSPDPAHHARYGVILFIVYVILYGTFVYLSAFRADLMASKPFGGVNLAILYGMGLIVSAFGLAIIYMLMCRSHVGERTIEGRGVSSED